MPPKGTKKNVRWSDEDCKRLVAEMLRLWIKNPEKAVHRLIDEAQKSILPDNLWRNTEHAGAFDAVTKMFYEAKRAWLERADLALTMLEEDMATDPEIEFVEDVIKVVDIDGSLEKATVGQLSEALLNRQNQMLIQSLLGALPASIMSPSISRFAEPAPKLAVKPEEPKKPKVVVWGLKGQQTQLVTAYVASFGFRAVVMESGKKHVYVPTSAVACFGFEKFMSHSTIDNLKKHYGKQYISLGLHGISEFENRFAEWQKCWSQSH